MSMVEETTQTRYQTGFLDCAYPIEISVAVLGAMIVWIMIMWTGGRG